MSLAHSRAMLPRLLSAAARNGRLRRSSALCALSLLAACAKGADSGEFPETPAPQQVGQVDAGASEAGVLPSFELDAALPVPGVDAAAPPTPDAAPPPADAGADAAEGGAAIAGFSFAPSNLDLAAIGAGAAPAATLNCGVTEVDTSDPVRFTNWCGTVPTPSVSAQSGGSALVVLPLDQLQVSAGSTLRVKGSRPLVLLVKGDATITGSVDVSATAGAPGPGGNLACDASAGGDGQGNADRNGGGGGGGGFGSRGGQGGDDSGDASQPGAAGQARGNTDLVPLLAGCGGGRAGGSCAGVAGAGAGALQISAGGALVVRGALHADGGNGSAGCDNDAGGTGAGSGGALLLEARSIDVTGATITARGGAGGEGQNSGAAGAGADRAAQDGGEGGEGRGSGGGGGGGGFGRIRLRAQEQCTGCAALVP